jgi:ketosteroid isomerase-like protein
MASLAIGPRGSIMAITDQEVFETGTDAFNEHDLARIEELLDDDVVFLGPGDERGEGKAACLEFYGGWFDDFPDAHLEIQGMHFFDDVAIEEGTFTGTHSGRARTGREVSLEYVRIIRSCDGKHVSERVMLDVLLMLEQLGLSDDAAPSA